MLLEEFGFGGGEGNGVGFVHEAADGCLFNSPVDSFWRSSEPDHLSLFGETEKGSVDDLCAETFACFEIGHTPIGSILEQFQQFVTRCHKDCIQMMDIKVGN